MELRPGGLDFPVTNSNRISYIHLAADYQLKKQVSLGNVCKGQLFERRRIEARIFTLVLCLWTSYFASVCSS